MTLSDIIGIISLIVGVVGAVVGIIGCFCLTKANKLKAKNVHDSTINQAETLIVNNGMDSYAVIKLAAETTKEELNGITDTLPEEFQCEIIGYLLEKAPEYKDMEKFAKEFVLVSNSFIDCRYAFEEGVPSFDFRFLAALANASIRGLLTHYDVKLVQMQEKPMTDEELDKMIEDNRQHYIEKNISYIAKQKKESLS